MTVTVTPTIVRVRVSTCVALEGQTRDAPFVVAWTVSDITAGSKALGTIPAGRRVQTVELHVTTACNAACQCTIGDASAHGRLMTAADSLLTQAEMYSVESSITYASATALLIYFLGSVPTQGAGTVVVYYQ